MSIYFKAFIINGIKDFLERSLLAEKKVLQENPHDFPAKFRINSNMNLDKSLEDLGIGDADAECISYFAYDLYKTPLKNLSTLNISLMLGQCVAEQYLIPLALERICSKPLERVIADSDELNLLLYVMLVNGDYWDINEKLRLKVDHLCRALLSYKTDDKSIKKCQKNLSNAYLYFDEFSPLESKLYKIEKVKKACYGLSSNIRILTIIAAKDPIEIHALECLFNTFFRDRFTHYFHQSIDHLLAENVIKVQYEGSFPAPKIVRLNKDLKKQIKGF